MPTVEEVSSRVPSTTPAFSVSSLSRSLVSKIPWYFWLVALCAAWLKWGSPSGGTKKRVARSTRKRLPVSNAGQNTPRRVPPTLNRRGSFTGRPEMRERRGSSASWTPAHRERPQPSPVLAAPPGQNSFYATQPRANSSLRHSTAPSPPVQSQDHLSKKRAHEVEPSVGAGPKRSKFDSFHSEAAADGVHEMDLDLDPNGEDAVSSTIMHDEEVASGRNERNEARTDESFANSALDHDMRDASSGYDVPRERSVNSKKRSSRESPQLSDEGEDEGSAEEPRERVERRISKKAKKQAIGTGSVRDKRGIDQVGSDDDVRHLEIGSQGGKRERNADSEVESDEEESRPAERDSPKGGFAKRFREKLKRSGSDDEDLMGDDDLLSPPPPGPPVAKRLSTSTPKKRLSSRSARKLKQSTATVASRTPKRPASSRPSPIGGDSEKDRKVGEVWQNHEGDYYRLDEPENGAHGPIQRRLVECKEKRRKYKLPKDVRHPDTKEMHDVVVERWVTQEEYRALFEQRKLAWQVSYEEEEREKERDELGDQSMKDATPPTRQEKELGLYYSKGTNSPLRTHSALPAQRFMSTSSSASSLSALAASSPKVANSASTGALSSLAVSSRGGRLRLPSTQGIQSPARRAWSIAERTRTAALSKEREAEEEMERGKREAEGQRGGDKGSLVNAPKPEAAKVDRSTPPTHGGVPLALGATQSTKTIARKPETSAPLPSFSFGSAPAASEVHSAPPGQKITPPSISFNSAPSVLKAPAPSSDPEPSKLFSIGKSTETVPASASPPSFSFSTSGTSADKKGALSTGFSFGTTERPKASGSSVSPASIAASTAALPSSTQSTASTTPSFAFGPSTTAKTSTPAVSTLAFGTGPPSVLPTAAAPGGFSFATSLPGAGSSPNAPSGGLSVNGAGGFSFGQAATGPTAPTELFSFGAGSGHATPDGATTPRRRTIRKLPGR